MALLRAWWQVARTRRWPVQLTDELLRADAVLAGRNQLGRHPELRKRARDGAVPIHAIKADSLPQVQRFRAFATPPWRS